MKILIKLWMLENRIRKNINTGWCNVRLIKKFDTRFFNNNRNKNGNIENNKNNTKNKKMMAIIIKKKS